ncbi:MAG: hypothetical protein K8T25_15280 [Planctomycetia bacterium]|nr:hypothetical protein [Planctomycetia bacterium]
MPYRVEQRNAGGVLEHVFLDTDPRTAGYSGPVEEDVFISEESNIAEWPEGSERPEPCLGRSIGTPKQYTTFRNQQEMRAAKYELIEGIAVVPAILSDFSQDPISYLRRIAK